MPDQFRDWTLLTDLYQLNMMYAHHKHGTADTPVACDLFYRTNPFGSGYAIAAGLEVAADYLERLRFRPADLEYLRSLQLYDEGFLTALAAFRFTGDVAAVPEGTPVFPGIPLMRVICPVFQAHLVETAVTNIVGHQTLIATKAARVVQAAAPSKVIEFGLRRAHGPDAGLYGSRAAVIAGCMATSNVLAGKSFHVQVAGTHAHAWVQFWGDERTAFRRWAEAVPGGALLLVDTYDTIKSGLPAAIQAARTIETAGGKFLGIRLDSGDLAYLSKQARQMLDDAGFPHAMIVASSDLDEYLIRDLKVQGARIDVYGVGTNLVTARDWPSLGCVFKLVAVQNGNGWEPRIKVSENPIKVTNPGIKKVVRIYENATGKAAGDLLLLDDEPVPAGESITLFDPHFPWKRKTVENFTARELLVEVFRQGERVYHSPPVDQLQADSAAELARFWEEYRRLVNPETYPVDLSPALWQLKNHMLEDLRTQLGGD